MHERALKTFPGSSKNRALKPRDSISQFAPDSNQRPILATTEPPEPRRPIPMLVHRIIPGGILPSSMLNPLPFLHSQFSLAVAALYRFCRLKVPVLLLAIPLAGCSAAPAQVKTPRKPVTNEYH